MGGNDELIFDGGSFVADAEGRILHQLPLFEEAFAVIDVPSDESARLPDDVPDLDLTSQLERGLVLGIHDYFRKQGLPPGAVIGLSGGIDSAVTAHLAVEALGAEQVVGIAMPGPFSSEHSVTDALALGENLGIDCANGADRGVSTRPIATSSPDYSGPKMTTDSPNRTSNRESVARP